MAKLFEKVKQKFAHGDDGKATSATSATNVQSNDDSSSSSSSSSDEGGLMPRSGGMKKWHSGKDYSVGDRVGYKKQTYECLVSHHSVKGIPPAMDVTNWMMVTQAV